MTKRIVIVILWAVAVLSAARAQDAPEPPETFSFEGGTLTITRNEDYEKVLDFNGKELARNFDLSLDRMVEVSGVKVALFAVGDGGNMCPPATVIVWKLEGSEEVETQAVGEDCGSPPPAVASDAIYFVPYLLPGASDVVGSWSPSEGLLTVGSLTYAPEAGTSWTDLDPAKLYNIIDALRNEAVYRASMTLLGDKLTGVVTGLLVGGGTESTSSGAFYASGCVPHNCGGSNTFMAVDPKARKVYFAQQGDTPEPNAWPAADTWPEELREAMHAAVGGG